MLGLDMALDADLGIDSIKRVEILSALQERLPGAPAVKPEHLGTLLTLRHIADFLNQPQASGGPQAPVAAREQGADAPRSPEVRETKRGQRLPSLERTVPRPVPLTAPRAPLARPAGAEVWVTGEDLDLARALEQQLAARGLTPRLRSTTEVPHLIVPASLGGLVLLAPAGPVEGDWLRDALFAAQAVGPALRRSPRL